MRLFKKHKAKDKLSLNVGIKECSTCDMNLRCEECVYQNENENIKSEIERLKKLLAESDTSYNKCAKRFYKEGIKEFAERLNEGAQIADCFDSYNMVVGTHFIDNLLKEMIDG